jgi:hypothetical protein
MSQGILISHTDATRTTAGAAIPSLEYNKRPKISVYEAPHPTLIQSTCAIIIGLTRIQSYVKKNSANEV